MKSWIGFLYFPHNFGWGQPSTMIRPSKHPKLNPLGIPIIFLPNILAGSGENWKKRGGSIFFQLVPMLKNENFLFLFLCGKLVWNIIYIQPIYGLQKKLLVKKLANNIASDTFVFRTHKTDAPWRGIFPTHIGSWVGIYMPSNVSRSLSLSEYYNGRASALGGVEWHVEGPCNLAIYYGEAVREDRRLIMDHVYLK